MSPKKKASPDSIVREIKRRTRRKFTAEEKIRIVLEGLCGEENITQSMETSITKISSLVRFSVLQI
jgi:hypothetical protein